MFISYMSIHRKPELKWRGLIERLGVGKPTPREMVWCTEWVFPVATAMTDQIQTPK